MYTPHPGAPGIFMLSQLPIRGHFRGSESKAYHGPINEAGKIITRGMVVKGFSQLLGNSINKLVYNKLQ